MVAGLPPRKRGVKFGPKPKLAAHQQREAVRMVRAGRSLREVAYHYHVGHSTFAASGCRNSLPRVMHRPQADQAALDNQALPVKTQREG